MFTDENSEEQNYSLCIMYIGYPVRTEKLSKLDEIFKKEQCSIETSKQKYKIKMKKVDIYSGKWKNKKKISELYPLSF